MTPQVYERGNPYYPRKSSIAQAKQLVAGIRSVHPNSKCPKGIVEQEIVFRKHFLSLDEANRFSVINTLATVGSNDLARQLLMNVLVTDPSPLVRHEAAFALGCIGDQSSVAVLEYSLLRDESFLVRHEAAMALGELGSERGIRSLQEGLGDKSREVVISCRVALQRINDKHVSRT